MRFPKGSVDIRESHDLPLLRHVLDTQFVTTQPTMGILKTQRCRAEQRFSWLAR